MGKLFFLLRFPNSSFESKTLVAGSKVNQIYKIMTRAQDCEFRFRKQQNNVNACRNHMAPGEGATTPTQGCLVSTVALSIIHMVSLSIHMVAIVMALAERLCVLLEQVSGWYTSVLRDEVLAEWNEGALHIHCTISSREIWWLAPGRLRNYIFCRELPLVRAQKPRKKPFSKDHPLNAYVVQLLMHLVLSRASCTSNPLLLVLDSVRYAERTFLQQHKGGCRVPYGSRCILPHSRTDRTRR
eukprot:5137541-Pyramimonas_sp.AAC.1